MISSHFLPERICAYTYKYMCVARASARTEPRAQAFTLCVSPAGLAAWARYLRHVRARTAGIPVKASPAAPEDHIGCRADLFTCARSKYGKYARVMQFSVSSNHLIKPSL